LAAWRLSGGSGRLHASSGMPSPGQTGLVGDPRRKTCLRTLGLRPPRACLLGRPPTPAVNVRAAMLGSPGRGSIRRRSAAWLRPVTFRAPANMTEPPMCSRAERRRGALRARFRSNRSEPACLGFPGRQRMALAAFWHKVHRSGKIPFEGDSRDRADLMKKRCR
jgi:hypothetical protein